MKNHPVISILYVAICLFICVYIPYSSFFSELPTEFMTEHRIIVSFTALTTIFVALYGGYKANRGKMSVLVFSLAIMYLLLLPSIYYYDTHCTAKFCNMLYPRDLIFVGSLAGVTLLSYFIGKLLIRLNIPSISLRILSYLTLFLTGIGILLDLPANIIYFEFLHDLGRSDFGPVSFFIAGILIYVIYIIKIAEVEYIDTKISTS